MPFGLSTHVHDLVVHMAHGYGDARQHRYAITMFIMTQASSDDLKHTEVT